MIISLVAKRLEGRTQFPKPMDVDIVQYIFAISDEDFNDLVEEASGRCLEMKK
jgi:hypothetical protein